MEISKQFASGEREIINEPAVNKNLMRKAALFEQQQFTSFKAKAAVPTYYCTVIKLSGRIEKHILLLNTSLENLDFI